MSTEQKSILIIEDEETLRSTLSCRLRGEGYLVVLKQQDADHYQQVAKIETAKLARTMCYNAETGRLYLGVPRQEGKAGPEIRVFQVR